MADSIIQSRERQRRYRSNPDNQSKIKKRAADQHVSRKARGVCLTCGTKPPLEGLKYCGECKVKFVAYHKERRDKRASLNLCTACGKCPSVETARHGGRHGRCEECLLKKCAGDHLGSETLWRVLRDKLEAQGFRCAYTGRPLTLGVNASVDHKMPVKHYPHLKADPDNLEWVCWEVNDMKRARTPEEFLSLIRLILHYRS